MNKELIFKDINDILWNDFIETKTFFTKYRSVENYALENGLTGTIYEYNFPDKNESNLKINATKDGLSVSLKTPDGIWNMGYERTPGQLYDACEKLRETLIKYSLLYSPKVTNEFINELNQIKEDEIIDFNTRLSVICLKNIDTELIFKKQFEGTLDSLKINDFKHSQEFVINKTEKSDYQSLFNNAYNYRSNTCDIRRRFQTRDGYDILKDIESKLEENDVFSKNIGPIHLKVIKQNNEITWLDNDNSILNRNDIATLFSWVKNSNVDYNVINIENGISRFEPERQNQVNITFLQEIKQASNDLQKVMEIAFRYNDILHSSAISISGLKDDETHNYNSCSFVFKEGKIIKVDFFDGSFKAKDIKSIGEIEPEEFISFMSKRKENLIKEINQECKIDYEEFQRMHPHFTQEETKDFVKRTMAKKIEHKQNPYGFNEELINNLDEVVEKIVDDYIKTKNDDGFSLKNLLYNEEEEENDKDLS